MPQASVYVILAKFIDSPVLLWVASPIPRCKGVEDGAKRSPGKSRSAGTQNTRAEEQAAWLWNRSAHSESVGRGAAGGRGIDLPSAAPYGTERLDQLGMGAD